MKKLTKNIVAVILSMSLLLSMVGINLSVHTCKATNITDVSLIFHNSSNGDHTTECPTYSLDEQEHACHTETVASDCCSMEQIPDDLLSIEGDNCCIEFFEFFQAKYELATITEIDLSVLSSVLYIVEADFFSLLYTPEKPNKVLSHHSGISPPYISTYIYFIASILK